MKRGTLIALVVGILAVVVIVAGVWWFFGRPQGPEATARAYLDALEDGDYAAIDALRAERIDDPIVEAAFAAASGRVGDPQIIEVTQEDGTAAVDAEVELGGETRGLGFTLEQSDGRWVLSGDDLGVVRATVLLADRPVGDTVRIGDALAPAGGDVALLPAEYEISPAPRILTGTGAISVVPGETATVEIDGALSDEATALAQEQLDAYLDTCAAPATEVPSNCGIRVPWAADLTSLDSIAFRIDRRPAVALSADARQFDATQGVIVATATGPSRSGGTGSFTYRAEDWALRGDVRFEGEQMILSVR